MWKETISFVMSVRLEQLSSHWMDFCEIWFVSIFLKSLVRIQASLKSYNSNDHFTCLPIHIYDHILLSAS